MLYDIFISVFISVVIVVWCFSGIFIWFCTVGEPSHHAEAVAIILFYFLPAMICAGLGPFTGIFWIIKKVAQRYG